jgi:hypothetical protein
MSNKEDHRIGITPIVLRRAAYYLALGLGEYAPEHPHYDKVRVDKLYDLMQNPLTESEWGLGIRVSFYQDQRCVRWVEFSCRTTGVGGDPVLESV